MFDDQYLLPVTWHPGRSRPLEQNRASRLVLSLFPGFSHVGGDWRRVPQSEWLESVAEKFRIFAAVVSKPTVPKRIGGHTVVRDPIAGGGDDVFDGLAGPQARTRAKQLLRGNSPLIGLL